MSGIAMIKVQSSSFKHSVILTYSTSSSVVMNSVEIIDQYDLKNRNNICREPARGRRKADHQSKDNEAIVGKFKLLFLSKSKGSEGPLKYCG